MNIKTACLGIALPLLAVSVATPMTWADQHVTSSAPAGIKANRNLIPPGYVFNASVPHDLVGAGDDGLQLLVDNLAWNTFIALNWPVPQPITQRGVPDRQNVIGGAVTFNAFGGKPTISPTGPTVWETYKDTADIFLKSAKKPSSFDTPETIPAACQSLALANPQAARRTLWQTTKASDVLNGFQQAFTMEPLIDQNGEKVWYEVKVNRAYYDYVVNNGFYNSNNQKGKTIAFPASSNTSRGEGAVKVKAAWKVIGGKDNPKNFYTTDALIYDPQTKQCSKKTVGLVGLHITQKTAQLPQWMWATFEHVNNAPDLVNGVPAPTTGVQYNFYNPACTACPINTPPSKQKPGAPTQVARVVPVDSTAALKNGAFQTALQALRSDNVWQNYMLVNAQWGASPSPIGTPNQPSFLANTTMETYLKHPVVDKKAPHGCINCHGGYAGNTDLDFQISDAYPRPKK